MFQQVDAPVGGSLFWSAVCGAIPLLTLFVLLGLLRWKAWQAALASLAAALVVAVVAYDMPVGQALLAGAEGGAFGLFPILFIVLAAVWVFRLTEITGYDIVLRRSFESLSSDHRVQAILIAFCFGALLEALAGFGTPVAVTAVMLIAVGLTPMKAAAVALVANTAPVAFGAIAVPITTLGRITGIDPDLLGAMVGRQTPILAVFVPFILVVMVDGVRGLRQVWPAALVGGLAFAIAQFITANYIAYEVADIVAAGAGAIGLVVLLRFWQPAAISESDQAEIRNLAAVGGRPSDGAPGPASGSGSGPRGDEPKSALLAFSPYIVIVVLFALTSFGPLKTFLDSHAGWKFAWPGLDVLNSSGKPLAAATFNFNLWTAGGTVLVVAAVITALLLKVAPRTALVALGELFSKFRWTIVTVVSVLALAYLMNFSGQTVTLGLALAATGGFFAFLSPVVGWIGVAVTGSDTSANSLFGLLQVTAAQRTGISPILLAAANTSGGVVGKMVSPQNLAIAAAVVGLEGRESDLLRSVAKWTGILLLGVCVLVYLQSTPVLGWMVVA